MSGIDGYTKLLLHCDGIDESTTFTDSSNSNHTVTANENAQIDTAQKVFGDSALLCDGAGDNLSIPDSADWDFGSGDFTIDCRIRFNSVAGNQSFFTREVSSVSYFYIAKEGSNIRFRDYGGSYDSTFAWSPVADTWYHFAITRSGNSIRCFIDGTQIGSTQTFTGSFIDRSVLLRIGTFPLASYYLNGWMDEIRVSKGIARWTSNFTPPTEAYSSGESGSIDETINIDDAWAIQTNPESHHLQETAQVDDAWVIQTNPANESLNETVTVDDSWTVQKIEKADYAIKIISADSLIFVTNSTPTKILHVDISTPSSPVITGETIDNVTDATDVSYNSETEYIYVSCADGKVVKIDINDLSSQSIIDLSDTDDLQTIQTYGTESLTYTTTADSTGELYLIDEREAFKIDTNFQYLTSNTFSIETQFDFIETFKLDTNFQYLQENNFTLNTDFKWLADSYSDITPKGRTDFHVHIDDVELDDDDLVLNSIDITHTIDEESIAIFKVARKHDAINSPLNGGTVQLTNQNNVKIYIDSNLEFNGKVSNLNCIYSNNNDIVEVSATMTQLSDNRKTVTMSLPSIDASLGLYDILVQNPNIYNPYINPNDENPEIYKGIRVDLGTRIKQSVSRYRVIETIIDNKGVIAQDIEDGDFEIKQNWKYFWLAKARNFITHKQWTISRYIGTSLSSLTSDTWEIIGTPYYKQREWADTETELGNYTVGSAPYLDVSVKNGELIAVNKYTDKDDGFYSEKKESYNYVGKLQLSGAEYQTVTKGYAQKVADLEYSKLLNINGDVLPLTSANLEISIDAYYYYALKLLTRINIDNTTTVNIFNKNNGFPVSIKSINISSATMKVMIDSNNSQSSMELEEIDDTYPDETDEEYLFSEESTRMFRKYDPNLNKFVE